MHISFLGDLDYAFKNNMCLSLLVFVAFADCKVIVYVCFLYFFLLLEGGWQHVVTLL